MLEQVLVVMRIMIAVVEIAKILGKWQRRRLARRDAEQSMWLERALTSPTPGIKRPG
jgi:cytochrome oxidase assembly protein ShyY1